MHKRGAPKLSSLELYHLLDCVSHVLCSEMVYEPDEEAREARRPCPYQLAVSRMQLIADGGAQHIPLLVWQGGEPEVYSRPATPFVWPDLF